MPPPPAPPEELPTQGLRPRRAEATDWRRWELAPGLELHLADTADAKTQQLAEHLRALIQKTQER